MVKMLHNFFRTFQNYQRVAILVVFAGLFGLVGLRVLTDSFADTTSIINGYKVDKSGQPSSTPSYIANVPVEYTCCTLAGNSSPQSANPYSFSNLPQGLHQISIYSANIPTGWYPLYALCWEDGSCRNPNPTAMTYEGSPHNRYTVVLDTTGHGVAHLWFHFRQNRPAVNVTVSPSSVAYDGFTTVAWSATNSPTSCSNDFGGANSASGSKSITNLTSSRNFTVSCTNSGGTGSDTKPVTVAAKPTPPPTTPPPTSGGTSGGSSGGSSSTTAKPPLQGSNNTAQPTTAAADTTPPSAPANFLAEPDSSKPSIDLSWGASTDAGSLQGYQLERSTDQQNWTPVTESFNDVFYTDEGLTFSTHYYYRIKAVDSSKNASAYATADATTAGFQSNVSKDNGGTVESDDKNVSVVVPGGAFDQDAYCDIVSPHGLETGVNGFALIAGPYQLHCQASDGTLLTDLKSPASARINIDAKQRKNYSVVRYYEKDGDNWQQVLGKDDSFDLKNANSFALFGKRKTTPIWVKIIIVLLVLVGIAAAVLGLLYLRYRRGLQAKADDYWRKSKGF